MAGSRSRGIGGQISVSIQEASRKITDYTSAAEGAVAKAMVTAQNATGSARNRVREKLDD